jgi:hypothetical protein
LELIAKHYGAGCVHRTLRLVVHVRAHPDALLRERAAEFGVSSVAIFKALRQLDIRKKNDAVRGNKPQ